MKRKNVLSSLVLTLMLLPELFCSCNTAEELLDDKSSIAYTDSATVSFDSIATFYGHAVVSDTLRLQGYLGLGFIVSTNPDLNQLDVTEYPASIIRVSQTSLNNYSFSADVPLSYDKQYYYRSYMKKDGVCFYGETKSFIIDSPAMPTEEETYTDQMSVFLRSDPGQYSLYYEILKRSGFIQPKDSTNDHFFSGNKPHTVFVPTNDALIDYLNDKGYGSIDMILQVAIDAIAKATIFDGERELSSLSKMLYPEMNLLYDNLFVSIRDGKYILNNTSTVLKEVSTLKNNHVVVIDRMFDTEEMSLADQIACNPEISLFNAAMRFCCLDDSLLYYTNPESVEHGLLNASVLAVTDSFFASKGIYSVDDLNEYAKMIYPGQDYPLFNLMSSHILIKQNIGQEFYIPGKMTKAESNPYQTMNDDVSIRIGMENDDYEAITNSGKKYQIEIPECKFNCINGTYFYINGIID